MSIISSAALLILIVIVEALLVLIEQGQRAVEPVPVRGDLRTDRH